MPSPINHFHTNCDDRITAIVEELAEKGYKPLGTGKERTVMTRPNGRFVLKIPYLSRGEDANRVEAERYQERKDEKRLAKCKLVKLYGMDCLLMEKVREMTYPEIYSHTNHQYDHWIHRVDCEQVGYNRRGDVVAWDYGD